MLHFERRNRFPRHERQDECRCGCLTKWEVKMGSEPSEEYSIVLETVGEDHFPAPTATFFFSLEEAHVGMSQDAHTMRMK